MRLPLASHRERDVEAAREPRRVVQRQESAEDLGEERGGDEEKGRLLHERLAAERRDHPVAALEDVEDQAEGVGLVGLPGVVADEAEEHPAGEHGNCNA